MSAPASLLVSGARLLDPLSGRDEPGYLGVSGGRIDYVGREPPNELYEQSWDAAGQWLMPSLIDLAARLREPGATHKASIASETRAAHAGGITTVVVPPDTQPVIDSPAMCDRIHALAALAGLDVRVLGALTRRLDGEALAEMSSLRRAGCIGVSNAHFPLRDSLVGRRALEYAHGLDLSVHVFAQNPALANQGCAHEGPVATRLGLSPIPVAAEVSAIRFWISLVEDTGARVHFGRLSTARGAYLVELAQARGLPVTGDVAAHQLFLTAADVEGFNAMAHVIPPLRSVDDRDGLREALARGVISAVCSDHQPHEADAKINPFPLTEPGISGLETLLPLVLELVHEGLLTPLQAAQRLSLGPAQVLGLGAGSLAVGTSADLVLVDPDRDWVLKPSEMLSRGHNTPFGGRRFRGLAMATIHRGRIVHRRVVANPG